MHDARILQILFLGTLLAAGAWLRDFSLRPSQAALTFLAGAATQVLFAFFMISDPMTIPNHPRGRIVHAALVAGLAAIWQFGLYRPNGLLFALFLLAPAVALWDRLWPAPKFTWQQNASQGGTHGPMFAIRPRPDIPARPAGTAGLDSLVPGNIASLR